MDEKQLNCASNKRQMFLLKANSSFFPTKQRRNKNKKKLYERIERDIDKKAQKEAKKKQKRNL